MKSLNFSLFNLFGNSKSRKKSHHRTRNHRTKQRHRNNHFNKRRGTRRNYKMRGG